MINSISQSAKALTAYENKLAASSHNIANINTEGYKKLQTKIVGDKTGAPETQTTRSAETGPASVDLSDEAVRIKEQSNVSYVEEATDQIVTQRGYEANLKTIQTADETTGTTIDIVS